MLEHMQREPAEVVVSDVRMPEITGLEAFTHQPVDHELVAIPDNHAVHTEDVAPQPCGDQRGGQIGDGER